MLPEQAQFRVTSPAQLVEDLQREHRAIREEFRLAGKFFQPAPGAVYPRASSYQAAPWDMIVLVANCVVTFPQLNPESAGALVTFILRAGTLTAKSDTGAKIQNASSENFTSVGRVVYQFDGLDWWR